LWSIGTLIVYISIAPLAEGILYTDINNRYTINFPNGWVKTSAAGIDVAYYENFIDDYNENINIVSAKDTGIKNTKELVMELGEIAIDKLIQQFPGATLVSGPEARLINDHWSGSIIIDWTYNGIPLRQLQTYVVSEGYSIAFIITCTATQSSFSSYQKTFNTTVNSFEIINEPAMNSFFTGLIIVMILGGLIAGLGTAIIILIFRKNKGIKTEIIDIIPSDKYSGIYINQQYPNKPLSSYSQKNLLIQCPSCSQTFELFVDRVDSPCPHCGILIENVKLFIVRPNKKG
jgi:hypothetical protein